MNSCPAFHPILSLGKSVDLCALGSYLLVLLRDVDQNAKLVLESTCFAVSTQVRSLWHWLLSSVLCTRSPVAQMNFLAFDWEWIPKHRCIEEREIRLQMHKTECRIREGTMVGEHDFVAGARGLGIALKPGCQSLANHVVQWRRRSFPQGN